MWHIGVSAAVVLLSLLVGMLGYVNYEHLGWLDAFLNAAMLLGGMGPVDPPKHTGGKLFAGFFALSNRMANATGMMPNEAFYRMGR